MKLNVRVTALVVVIALSLACAPRSSQAGEAATSTASNCFFVRNHLPCPCPHAQQARALAHAAGITAGALGTAFGKTAAALTRIHSVSASPRNASQPAKR